MTRKQALLRAIDVLSSSSADQEAVQKLKEMVIELPLTHWTDMAVRDAVAQYVEDHGQMPRPDDFRTRSLPPITAIHRLYSLTVGEWLEKNYTIPKVDRSEEIAKQHKQQTELFIREYHRIKPHSREDYDRKRSSGLMSSQTIMIYNNAPTWTQLRLHLGLPKYPATSDIKKLHLCVDIHHDFSPEDELFD